MGELRLYEDDKKRLAEVKEKIKQQKSGLKNLLLEKKLDTINESLEITMAQVGELVMTGSADQVPGAISQRLDELIEYKNEFIAYLHEEVQRIQDAYKQMVRAYQAKLAEYGIPAEELGFVPAD